MLSLSHFSVLHEQKQIVKDVSLSVKPGSIHALMGPNGSGKSTLSLGLAGHPHYQVNPQSQASLDQVDLIPLLPHERAQAGLFLTFQSPVAIPGVSVKHILKLMVEHVRQQKITVRQLIEEIQQLSNTIGLSMEMLDRNMHEGFSGGEKKRIEMLALLLAQPKYAILDEIDSGLDVDAIKMVTTAIKLAQKQSKTGFLIVTHYRRILEYLSVDQVHVLAQGKLVAEGDDQLIHRIESHGYIGLA